MDTGSKTVPTLCRSKTGLYETIITPDTEGSPSWPEEIAGQGTDFGFAKGQSAATSSLGL
jgi:hypothetical protein